MRPRRPRPPTGNTRRSQPSRRSRGPRARASRSDPARDASTARARAPLLRRRGPSRAHHEALLTCRSDADDRDRHAAELLEEPHVLLRLLRQFLELPYVADLVVPSGELLPHGLGLVEQGLVGRDVVVRLAAGAIADADAQRLEAAEHVELREREVGQAVEPRRVPQHAAVEPAAPTLAPGRRAELGPTLAQPDARGVERLRRERAAADARDVRLRDADDALDVRRP